MSEETQTTEMRVTGQSEASEKLLRDTNMSNTENIIQEAGSNNEEPKKVNSFNTVLSIWNNMIGSSTVVLPYNVFYCGIIPAIILCIIYGLICFYTCKVYYDFGINEPDFSTTIEKYFKRKFGPKIAKIGKNTQILFCTLITLGGLLIYFLIVSQNLYPIVCLILNKIFKTEIDSKNLEPEFGRFSLIYLGIILAFFLFPLTVKKDVGFLVKLSSFGIYFISILIIFVIYTGISSLINTNFHLDYIKNKTDSKERYLYLFGQNPGDFTGTLSMGYFCHTAILPILKTNKNQKNNIRDLALGYIFVGLTFSLCGIMGYIGFSGKKFDVDFQKNWFYFFDYDDYFTLVFRLMSVFQLMSVFPILVYIVRFQSFNFFFGNEYPSKKHVYIYGVSILILCLTVVYFLYDFLNKLIGFIGATTSLILIYTFPPIIKMISYYMSLAGENINNETKNSIDSEIEKKEEKEKNEEEEKNEENEEKEKKVENEEKIEKEKPKRNISINENIANSETDDNNEKEDTDETEEIKKIEPNKNKKEIKNKDKHIVLQFKDVLYFIGQSSFILIGITTVILQLVPLNIFNISLKD